jgi:hypothetical protein
MDTEQHARRSTHAAAGTARAEAPTVCGCGQDLDIWAGTCCPRCGVVLTARAA